MTQGRNAHRELERRLHYRFTDQGWLQQALTHSSRFSGESGSDYERLEFLGDRVLALVIAELLFERYPTASEGEIGSRLAVLVSGHILAEVGRGLSLSKFILAAEAGRSTSPAKQESVIGNCCEAIIGAIYLDGGLGAARQFVHRLWEPLVDRVRSRPAKSALQEWLQGRGQPLPRYRIVTTSGPAHKPEFTIEVSVSGQPPVRATGSTIRAAEQEAAERMLAVLEIPA